LLAAMTFGCAITENSTPITRQSRAHAADARTGSDAGRKKAHTDNTAITWYSGGEAALNLNPVPTDLSSSVVLAGTTTKKNLVVKVAKKRGRARSNPIPLAADGSFNVRYLLKDGGGTYTITLFGSAQKNAMNYQGLGYFTHRVTKTLPANLRHLELNDKVLAFVTGVMGTTVGSGECWDLAQQALDMNLADWTRPTSFGRPLNPEKDKIKAGDIIQFRSVRLTEHLPGGGTRRKTLGAPDHTAIIYRVLGKKRYTLAHQNVGGRRSVLTSDIDLAAITGGIFRIYRPEALMVRQDAKSGFKRQ
jgi:hypothetical protein